jgi:putative transposase
MKLPPQSSEAEPDPEALFRFKIVSEVLVAQATGLSRAGAIADVVSRLHISVEGELRQVSARTVYRWLNIFEDGGYLALSPASRRRTDTSLVLPERFCDFLRQQKKEDPAASVPELILRARILGIIKPQVQIDRTTVYRACKRMGLPIGRRKRQRDRDSRRYAFPHRMDMVLCDGKHFRAGVGRLKRVVLFFLDDATRMGLHAVVGTAECAEMFIRGLYEAIRQHGLMSGLYLDHGPGFIASDTIDVVRQIGVLLVHGEKAYPEGHGKIERFNQTTLYALLRSLDGRPDVDPDCGALTIRIQHYLREVYNQRPHESLGRICPTQRFEQDERPLRFPDSDADLRSRFILHQRRHVSTDHVVSVEGVHFEMPRGYGDTWVVLQSHLLEGALRFRHYDKLITLKPVDPEQNARAPRIRRKTARPSKKASPAPARPKSAAHLLFDRDFKPVVTSDGDCLPTKPNKEDS